MKKFKGMLLCTDLDGTLYSDDKTVSKENLDAIEYFKSEGGLFTFITGRVPKTSKSICDSIAPNAPYGCMNGGGIFDPVEGKYLWKAFLPDEMLELVRNVDRCLPDMGIQLNTESEIYFNKESTAMERFRAITGVPKLSCSYEDVSAPVLKVVFAHESNELIEELIKLLDAHPLSHKFDFIRSERTLYELLPKGISKGDALCRLAELLNVEMRKTVAVGDYFNDVSMIERAGLGFAVENAVEEVKAAADHVTVSNNEHALAAIIDGLDRGLYKK